ncbi:MAG: acetyl-CoA acetyltransferase [Myxococcota bacterium]
MRRPVHIAGFAQLDHVLVDHDRAEAELVRLATAAALRDAGLQRADVGFTCSGSSDYAMGQPFSFVMALDGLGAWPPIRESHVEMDAAWALYEAWVRLQHGDVDIALVYGFGKSSRGDLDAIGTMTLDPYSLAPLGVSPRMIDALQARTLLDGGLTTEEALAHIAQRSRADGNRNPHVPNAPLASIAELLAAPMLAAPLRAHDFATRTDSAAAIVLRVGGGGPHISGLAHRIDAHQPGARDLTVAHSAALAAEAAGLFSGPIDAAELYATCTSHEVLLRRALKLGDGVTISPSGGALAADTSMVSGLVRIGEAANLIRHGGRQRVVAHAAQGAALQHNLVCVLEAP